MKAFISLGSNQGRSDEILSKAVEMMVRVPGIHTAGVSSLYETEPQGDKDQPWFFNQVARLECAQDMNPLALLDALQFIESRLGRVRDPVRRYGPRTIDLDILLCGDARVETGRLTLPHPRLEERAFVLVPLCELEPELCLPDGRSIRDILRVLPHTVEGRRIVQPETLENAG